VDLRALAPQNARSAATRLTVNKFTGVQRPETIEKLYKIDRDFARKLDATLCEHFPARQALAFMVRGLDVPNAQSLVEALLTLGSRPECVEEAPIELSDCLDGRR
jgi:hypothetical protein